MQRDERVKCIINKGPLKGSLFEMRAIFLIRETEGRETWALEFVDDDTRINAIKMYEIAYIPSNEVSIIDKDPLFVDNIMNLVEAYTETLSDETFIQEQETSHYSIASEELNKFIRWITHGTK